MFSSLPGTFATGDGYWLSICLVVLLLGIYGRLLMRLLWQLRQSNSQQIHTPVEQSVEQSPGYNTIIAVLLGALCLLPLADYWTNGYSGYHSIGGLLPYSDAADWLHGALHLATQGELSDWSARRPLNAVFLRGLLYLSDYQLPLMLLLRAGLVGAAIACWHLELRRQLPFLPALFVTLLTLLLAYPYLPVLLSESHGLLFGLLAFTFLLRGVTTNSLLHYSLGAGLLACALMMRMGGFGILLALLLWPLASAGPQTTWRWKAVTAVGISLGVGLSILWGTLVYSGDNSSGSNFSYTLYGLAHGGAPWQLFFEHHPDVVQQAESIQASLAYQAAWIQIQSQPIALLEGWWVFLCNYWRYLFVWVPGSLGPLLMPVFLLGLAQLIWRWRQPGNQFLLLCFAGILLTAPWIFWSANASRAFIATAPLELLLVGRGLHILWFAGQGRWRPAVHLAMHSNNGTIPARGAWVLLGLCLASLTLIPSWASRETSSLAHLASAEAAIPAPTCTPPARPLLILPKLAMQVRVDATDAGQNSWMSFRYTPDTFAQGRVHPNPIVETLTQTPSLTQQLWWLFDPADPKRYRYLYLDTPLPNPTNAVTKVCAQPAGHTQDAERTGSLRLLWQATSAP